ncbi:MAG TPA: PorP/SprF family type IX secretion system membrane protein [Saprospiraceae bacterium]|nr:PorP/SprF family type IX secretion system membrane protein [Saprospiraceae bacterium]
MLKRVLIFCFCLSISVGLYAQEQAVYRHYILHPTLINPGATGFNAGEHEFLGNVVNSWSGSPGTPLNYTFGYSGAFGNNVGLGIQLMNERNASINKFKAALGYAYKLRFDDIVAAIGLTTEFQQRSLVNGVLNDPLIDPSDEILLSADGGVRYFDMGLGLFSKINENLTLGVSLPNLVHTYLKKPIGANNDIKYKGNFTLYIANKFNINNYDFKLEPGLALRRVGDEAPLLGDVNLTGYFLNDKLIGGLGYHFGAEQNGYGLLLGINIGQVSLAYSFDIYKGDYQPYNNGKHEVTLSVNLHKPAMDQ